MYYIQESDKLNIMLKLFNCIKLNDYKIILPIKKYDVIPDKKAEKLAKKTNLLLEKLNCKKIILSKELKSKELYINYLNTYSNYEIIDGKWLFEVLSEQVIDYIVKKKKMNKEQIHISILVNDISDIMLEIIKQLATKYKKINIVTNHIEKFKKIEEKMLSKEGIMMIVNNNKRKSLAKSHIILNIDFPTELINLYNIYEESIIISIRNEIKINKKRFSGLVIKNYEINFRNIEEFAYIKSEIYDKKDIYEAQIYKNQPFDNIIRKIKNDKVEITKLIATNSEL